MLSRHNLQAHIRHLERQLRKAKQREELLVECIRRSQREHEKQIMLISIARRRYRSN